MNPLLNSNKPVTAACTKAVVAIFVELSPELGVITFEKPEESLDIRVLTVVAEVALDVTVNVVLPDWFAVASMLPDIPIPEVLPSI